MNTLKAAGAAALLAFATLAAPSVWAQTAPTTGFAEFIAKIKTNGNIIRASGLTAASRQSTGFYILTFPRDVSDCYVLASVAGEAGYAITQGNPTDPTQINILTFNPKGVATNRNVAVLVRCQD